MASDCIQSLAILVKQKWLGKNSQINKNPIHKMDFGNYSGASLQTTGAGVIAGTRCVSAPALAPFMRAKQSSPLFAITLWRAPE